jgi:hypothetical protein
MRFGQTPRLTLVVKLISLLGQGRLGQGWSISHTNNGDLANLSTMQQSWALYSNRARLQSQSHSHNGDGRITE